MIETGLYSKKGVVTVKMASYFLNSEVGIKIKSIDNLSKIYEVGRGTVQTVINNLIDIKAIKILKKGRNGTILTYKNNIILLDLLGKKNIYGCMPLPYTNRYEGLSTGIISSLREILKVNVSISYVKNAEDRILLLLENRIDFAIVSESHAREILKNNSDLILFLVLNDYSYVSKHVLVSVTKKIKKIGIDANSYVHRLLVENYCVDQELIQINYSNLKRALMNKEIDATILNFDDILEDNFEVNDIKEDKMMTRAAILINKNNNFLNLIIDKDVLIRDISEIQKSVIDKKIDPRL